MYCHNNMYRIYLFFIILSVPFVGPSGVKNYGSYDLDLKEVKNCKGPKRRECATTTYVLSEKATLSCYVTVSENTASIKGKLLGYLDKVEVVRLNLAKPCTHIFFMPLLKLIVKMTDKCVILKGNYNFSLDINDMMNKYHGSSYIFGNWLYKTILYNDECNLSCTAVEFAVNPRKKS